MDVHIYYDYQEQLFVVSIRNYPVSGEGNTLSEAISDFDKRYLDYIKSRVSLTK